MCPSSLDPFACSPEIIRLRLVGRSVDAIGERLPLVRLLGRQTDTAAKSSARSCLPGWQRVRAHNLQLNLQAKQFIDWHKAPIWASVMRAGESLEQLANWLAARSFQISARKAANLSRPNRWRKVDRTESRRRHRRCEIRRQRETKGSTARWAAPTGG